MEKLPVFEIVKPQGIKGELKARILADGFLSVQKIKKLYGNNNKEYLVKGIKDAFSGFAFILLDGVITRNDAELLRGLILSADKTDIKKGKNSYFISDLIGVKVETTSGALGVIEDVLQSNVDMLKVKLTNNKIAYIPFLKILSPEVDIDSKTMKIDGDKLDGVIYYESWYINAFSWNV